MKITTHRAALLAAALAGPIALVLPAGAQDAAPAAPAAPAAGACAAAGAFAFAAFDADGDGRITREELRAARAAAVAGLDADGDGFVTAAELAAHRLAQMQARIEAQAACAVERLDSDGDGRLGAAELAVGGGLGRAGIGAGMGPDPVMAERMFDRLDADGDGAVTEAEVARARERMQAMRRGDGPRGRMERDGMRGHGREGMGEGRRRGDRDGRMWMRP